jgi:DNA-binding transcriptional MerR regulator
MEKSLPSIPAKRYFTIGEVGELCGVKPHVLRYWEQEFTQLRPMKRRGNRRYYQHHEVLMIRRIRELLYDQGFTISGARNKLQELVQAERDKRRVDGDGFADSVGFEVEVDGEEDVIDDHVAGTVPPLSMSALVGVRRELLEIRELLSLQF